MNYATLTADRHVPQTEPRDARQVPNNAGGYAYALDPFARLTRFLVLGSDAPTYYQDARGLTRENARSVEDCWSADPERTAAAVVAVSVGRRAPKVSPAIFALVLGSLHPDAPARKAAFGAVGAVCRTASHLMEFVAARVALEGGWGRGAKRAVADWYGARPVEDLAYQMAKYRVRNGFDHVRLLRTSHSEDGGDPARKALYRWVLGLSHDADGLPDLVRGHVAAMACGDDPREVARLVEAHGLTREMVPTSALKDPRVWKALLVGMPPDALLRNLGALAEAGLTDPLSDGEERVASLLGDRDWVERSRLHPYQVLQALCVYRTGRAVKGERTWQPSRRVVDALDAAFEPAFANVEPTGKRHLLALDVSSSMRSNLIGGVVSAREGSAAMAMATLRREPRTHVMAFTQRLVDVDLTPKDRLDQAVHKVSNLPFGGTDCAQPMLVAAERDIPVDAFVVYTDNETHSGSVHPAEALRRYRKRTGIDAKLVVVGMTSTGFSIADPKDAGMLDVVGFDAGAIAAMAAFIRG